MIFNLILFLHIQIAFLNYDILTESAETFQTVLEENMSKKKENKSEKVNSTDFNPRVELLALKNMTSMLSVKEGLGGIKNLEHMEEFLEDTCKCFKSMAPKLRDNQNFYRTMVTMVFTIEKLIQRQGELIDVGNFYRKTKWIQTTQNISMISRLNRKAKLLARTIEKGLTHI